MASASKWRGRSLDLSGHYARWCVLINPLRFGAGVIGKIVNSLAMGLPVVTTGVGSEGLNLRNGVRRWSGTRRPQDCRPYYIVCTVMMPGRCPRPGAAIVFSERSAREWCRKKLLGLRICPVWPIWPAPNRCAAQQRTRPMRSACYWCLPATQSLAEVLLRLHRERGGGKPGRCAARPRRQPDIHEFGNHGAPRHHSWRCPGSAAQIISTMRPGRDGSRRYRRSGISKQLTYAELNLRSADDQDVFEHVPDPQVDREVLRGSGRRVGPDTDRPRTSRGYHAR